VVTEADLQRYVHFRPVFRPSCAEDYLELRCALCVTNIHFDWSTITSVAPLLCSSYCERLQPGCKGQSTVVYVLVRTLSACVPSCDEAYLELS